MALDESDWADFLKRLGELNANVEGLNARIDDLDKRLEELNGLVGQLFDLGGGLAEAFAEAKRGPNWGSIAEKTLYILKGFRK